MKPKVVITLEINTEAVCDQSKFEMIQSLKLNYIYI